MSEASSTPTEQQATAPQVPRTLQKGIKGAWWRILDSILPEIHYLEGETPQIEIRMAPYRRNIPMWILRISMGVLILSLVLAVVAHYIWSPAAMYTFLAVAMLAVGMIFIQLENLLLYEQWRFILTDKRIILVTPDPERKGFADAIYLKRGKIQVLDTNWSKHPFWGLLQAIDGSRDVMLSMSGYEFKEQGARVKGGLRFPDITPDDVLKLEQLIFG